MSRMNQKAAGFALILGVMAVSTTAAAQSNVKVNELANQDVAVKYLSIIEKYRTAQINEFYGYDFSATEEAGMNGEIALEQQYYNDDIYYALIDLANDGTPELFIATKTEYGDVDYCIYDMYGYQNGTVSRLFDVSSMGYRTLYSIMKNGIIEISESGGATYHMWDYYSVPQNSAVPNLIRFLVLDGYDGTEKYYKGTNDHDVQSIITETEFDNIRANYEYEDNITWYPLNDIGVYRQNDISVIFNNIKINFDQPPVITSDRVMVPIRAIFESMGYTVDWDQNNGTATAIKGNNRIFVQIGNSNINYTVNGISGTYSCDVAPQIIGNRTLVPIRAISESAGCTVTWDGDTRTVHINN